MGRVPTDWDIATSALPNEIKACFSHTFDTGIAHGTVTVVYNGNNYEITTYRIDGKYEDGRHPESVTFTTDIINDLARRDFTINAAAWHPCYGLVDPFGGKSDIENRIIRGVGNPELRFREDALRMMRAVRFSGQLGFSIASETLAAITRNAKGLRQISAERIRDEFIKLLLSPHPDRLSLLTETGLIDEGWPLPIKPGAAEINDSIKPIYECPKKAALVCAVLFFKREPEEAFQALNAMRFDKQLCRDTSLLIKWAKTPIINNDYSLRKYLSLCGASYFQDILTLKRVLKTTDSEILPLINARYDRIITNGDCLSIRNLQITGDDLLDMGLSGKSIGKALRYLLDLVLRDPSLNYNATLKQLMHQHHGFEEV